MESKIKYPNYLKAKQKTFKILEDYSIDHRHGRAFNLFIIGLVLLNTVIIVASTFEGVIDPYYKYTNIIEKFSILVFTIEYILRIWTSDLLRPNLKKIPAKLRYMCSSMAMIDLIAILPFYVPFFVQLDFRILWIMRIFRMLRILKITRYTKALGLIDKVLSEKKEQLLSSIFVVTVLMFTASVLMYYIEHPAQPEIFQNAFSGLWWGIATITTVGYGDIYPITALGKVVSGFIALLGIGLIAVPTGIISAGFAGHVDKSDKKEKEFCPYCGEKFEK